MVPRGLFIVGTDTEVGKTFVTASIARRCLCQGIRIGVYKPIASGWDAADEESQDAWQLWDAAGRPQSVHDVCPQRFEMPVAPHLAARAAGCSVDETLLVQGLQAWREYELVLVEGAGGLMTPISDNLYVADLAAEFNFPLVVVAANQLGVINQTLQTLVTASTFCEGLPISGIVLNRPRPVDDDASLTSNLEELRNRCVPPILASVKWQDPSPLDGVDWWELASPAES